MIESKTKCLSKITGVYEMQDLGLFSRKQLNALRCARDGGLFRDCDYGWCSLKYEERFECSTLRSLKWRGLLQTNFADRDCWLGFGNKESADRLRGFMSEPLIATITDRGKILLEWHEFSGDLWNSASSGISIGAKAGVGIPMQVRPTVPANGVAQ